MQAVGTQVTVPGSRGHGILRYYGPIDGKAGVFGGIELIGPLATSRGKNSGNVDGVQYFDVKIPQTGLFIPWERLRSSNPQLDNDTSGRISRQSSGNGRQLHIPKRSTQSTPEKNRDSRQEALFYKQQYETLKEETEKKSAILTELQRTVAELEQLLEEYERDLQERDKKLAKQRAEFERERENWRESMDLMSSTQQETELFYEEKLKELEGGANIEALKKLHEKEIDELQRKLEASQSRVETLEKQLEAEKNKNDRKALDDILTKMAHTSLNNNQLPIYEPKKQTDPSTGRDNWCGLCEQDGHVALECPYENDAF